MSALDFASFVIGAVEYVRIDCFVKVRKEAPFFSDLSQQEVHITMQLFKASEYPADYCGMRFVYNIAVIAWIKAVADFLLYIDKVAHWY